MGDAKSKSSTELSYTENKVEPAEHAIVDMRGFVEETLILSDDAAHQKYVDVIMEDNRLSAEERAGFSSGNRRASNDRSPRTSAY